MVIWKVIFFSGDLRLQRVNIERVAPKIMQALRMEESC
jgi:hypothetical protein